MRPRCPSMSVSNSRERHTSLRQRRNTTTSQGYEIDEGFFGDDIVFANGGCSLPDSIKIGSWTLPTSIVSGTMVNLSHGMLCSCPPFFFAVGFISEEAKLAENVLPLNFTLYESGKLAVE